MSNYDAIINKNKQKEQERAKPVGHNMAFKKPETKQDDYTEDEIDKKIRELTELKEKQFKESLETKRTVELTQKDKDAIPPDIDQKVVDTLYNKTGLGKLFGRKERNMIILKEKDGLKSKQWMILTLGIIGLFFLMSLQYMIHEQWVVIIILLMGSMMFLPVGMIVGWATLDPYVRCKILRKLAHGKNYGIINFVNKGNKIVSKIKNFDQALVWKKNETWVITKEHMYQLSKDGDTIVEKSKIDPESIVTLIDTVPVLFVDLDSMQPLSLARDRREGINPLELGSTLKAWVDNQLAKAMFLKKTMDMYLIIIMILCIASIGVAYINMTRMDDLTAQIKVINNQLSDVLSRLPA